MKSAYLSFLKLFDKYVAAILKHFSSNVCAKPQNS